MTFGSRQGKSSLDLSVGGNTEMAMQVSEEARQRTDKCQRGFACLSPDQKPGCAVRRAVRHALFVNREDSPSCSYDMGFGYSHICSCPVRWEIHSRYEA